MKIHSTVFAVLIGLTMPVHSAPGPHNLCAAELARASQRLSPTLTRTITGLCVKGDPTDGTGPALPSYIAAIKILNFTNTVNAKLLDKYGPSGCPLVTFSQTGDDARNLLISMASSACPSSGVKRQCEAAQFDPLFKINGAIAQLEGARACGRGEANVTAAVNPEAVELAVRTAFRKAEIALKKYGGANCPMSSAPTEGQIQTAINNAITAAQSAALTACP